MGGFIVAQVGGARSCRRWLRAVRRLRWRPGTGRAPQGAGPGGPGGPRGGGFNINDMLERLPTISVAMLRSATQSSFPVRRELIPLA